MADHDDETRQFTPGHADMLRLERKIDSLRDDFREELRAIVAEIKLASDRHAQFDVWKATIDMRLATGVERMNELKGEIDKRVKKETVIALLTGAACAGGGTAAGLMKLFGG